MFKLQITRLMYIGLIFSLSSVTFATGAINGPEVATKLQQKQMATGKDSMVVTNNPWASKAAQQILLSGGSAVDAAIAAGFVLGLTEPQSSGIGGGGYSLTYSAKTKKILAYDGREVAPSTANSQWFLDQKGKPLDFKIAYKTAHAIGVPGEVALFYKMHQEQGKLPWNKLLQPAIDLATNGFPLSPRLHGLLESEKDSLPLMPKFKLIYFTENNQVKPIGSTIVNLDYAASLKRIAKDPQDFYQGQLAQDIVSAINIKANESIYKLSDLGNYKVITYPPVCSFYRNKYKICSVPPSTSGGVTLEELLGIYANSYTSKDIKDPQWLYYFLEASKLAYADRNQYLADPDFVKQPVSGLLDTNYIKSRSKLIQSTAMPTPVTPGIPKGIDKKYAPDISQKAPGTTALAIVDKYGNAITMTVTIENQFGSHTFVDGFLLNNELTDFSFEPEKNNQLVANRVDAFKRPRSSIAPAMVFSKTGNLEVLAGSPGGSQIICYVAKSLIHILDFKQSPLEAASYPNLCAVNSIPVIESGTILTNFIPMFTKYGESVVEKNLVSGEVNIVHAKYGWIGAPDPRREGIAIGH